MTDLLNPKLNIWSRIIHKSLEMYYEEWKAFTSGYSNQLKS